LAEEQEQFKQSTRNRVTPLVGYPDSDASKSRKSKGTRTGLRHINAATFNIRPTICNRNRDGMAILFIGHLHYGAKRQRFVRRRQRTIVEGDAAGSFRSDCDDRLWHRRATLSSAETGLLSKQSTSAAINDRDHPRLSIWRARGRESNLRVAVDKLRRPHWFLS
jgi:hypothetical protein